MSFDRHLSIERLQGLGFAEQRDPVEGCPDAFKRFRKAKIDFQEKEGAIV